MASDEMRVHYLGVKSYARYSNAYTAKARVAECLEDGAYDIRQCT